MGGLPGTAEISPEDAAQGIANAVFKEFSIMVGSEEIRTLIERHGYPLARCFHVIWDDIIEKRKTKGKEEEN
jgi:hypothetical protein